MATLSQAEAVQGLRNSLGLHLDENYAWEAVQMNKSPTTEIDGRKIPYGNQSLACIGRAAADTEYAYFARNTRLSPGDAAELRQDRLSRSRLAAAFDRFELLPFISRNPCQPNGDLSPLQKADTVFAIVGAAKCSNEQVPVAQAMHVLGIYP